MINYDYILFMSYNSISLLYNPHYFIINIKLLLSYYDYTIIII